jgi:hypothetical protein
MHDTEPRNIGYGIDAAESYQQWTKDDATTLFSGKKQADLFVFAMALGKLRQQKSETSSKLDNIPVSALKERQRWAVLPIAISEESDLLSLKDEAPIYRLAEAYANEGIKILTSHMEKYGLSYPKKLIIDLKRLLNEQK